MIGGVSAPFIRRPVATTLMMVAILLVGPRRVSVSAGRAAAAGRLSDDFGHRVAARRVAGNDGRFGRPAARAADRANSRRLADDLDELARRDGDHRSVRSRPQHRRGRQRHPGGDQRRRGPIAQGSAEPADLPQGQSVRHADPHPVGSLGRRADHRSRRRGRKHPRPAHQPDLRRVAGARRRPAEAGDPHPDRSGQARRKEPAARGRARADRHRDGRQSQGRDHRSQPVVHDLSTTTS